MGTRRVVIERASWLGTSGTEPARKSEPAPFTKLSIYPPEIRRGIPKRESRRRLVTASNFAWIILRPPHNNHPSQRSRMPGKALARACPAKAPTGNAQGSAACHTRRSATWTPPSAPQPEAQPAAGDHQVDHFQREPAHLRAVLRARIFSHSGDVYNETVSTGISWPFGIPASLMTSGWTLWTERRTERSYVLRARKETGQEH